MPLSSSHTAKAKDHKHHTSAKAQKAGCQAMTDHQSNAEPQHDTTQQMLPPAHKNTPCTAYAGGEMI